MADTTGPRGNKIAFRSNRDGNGDVYVMDADGQNQTRLTAPTLNSVKPGAAVPVKFSLARDRGLNIFAATYPRSEKIGCDSSALVDGTH